MKASIAELWIYPVKGCRGLRVPAAGLGEAGLEVDGIGDREWMVVGADGGFLSQRQHPRLTLVRTRLAHEALRLQAPGMLALEVPFASEGDVIEVQVWGDRVAAVTQGEVADAWFSRLLEVPARLVRFDPEHRRLADRAHTGGDEVAYRFADAFPYLVASRASLADLNRRLAGAGHLPVTLERFRPNLVLDGVEAYDEDHLRSLALPGGAVLRRAKPCARCTVPGVDPDSGRVDPVVPDLLATWRRRDDGVMFGINAIVAPAAAAPPAPVREGDPVELAFDL